MRYHDSRDRSQSPVAGSAIRSTWRSQASLAAQARHTPDCAWNGATCCTDRLCSGRSGIPRTHARRRTPASWAQLAPPSTQMPATRWPRQQTEGSACVSSLDSTRAGLMHELQKLVCFNFLHLLDCSIRPADLHRIGSLRLSQAKVEPRVALRHVAAGRNEILDLFQRSSRHGHARADCVPRAGWKLKLRIHGKPVVQLVAAIVTKQNGPVV